MNQPKPASIPAGRSGDTSYWMYIACFFISGAAGLVYQIVWIRILSLVFGNTIYAVSMVVAAFLSGLALGSHVWGKKADSVTSPLGTYIRLEVLIAASALAVTLLVYFVDDLLVGLMTIDSITSGKWQILRYVILFALLLAPTSFMGGTTPMMTKFFIRSMDKVGHGVGSLYAANTYGGMAGCFISGFFLIPFLGVKGTLLLAVVLNLLVAAVLFFMGKESAFERVEEKAVKSIPRQKSKKKKKEAVSHETGGTGMPLSAVSIPVAMTLFAIAGFGTLVYEILWTRAFIVNFKSTVYLFSNLLAVFLLGMAIGSHLGVRILDRLKDPLKLFGISQVAIGVFGIFSILFFVHSAGFAYSIGAMFREMDWGKDVLVMLFLMLVVFIIPTALMGLSYPLICRVIADSLDTIGRKVGSVYAIGTAGGILGSLAAGFIFIPLFGLQKSILAISIIIMINGYAALLNSFSKKGAGWLIPVSGGLVVAAFVAFQIAGFNIGIGQTTEGKLVFAEEGVMGTVKVSQEHDNGPLTLMVNNYQLATSGDVAVRFGHIPLLLKPDANDVLLISLGSGITAGSISAHPVKNIECVEIVPSLLNVQPLFEKDNHKVVSDSRFKLTFWDGRHYVRVAKKKYDLVVADLFQPDSAGVGNLYSREHFANVKAKLREGGVMAQWLPLYQLSQDNLKVIMRTFAEVFGHVSVWYGDVNSELPTLLLLGSGEPFKIQPALLASRLNQEEVKNDMIEFGDPLSFLSFFIMDREGLLKFAGDAPINTDNNPIIEYSAPRNIWNRKEDAVLNFMSLISHRQNASGLLPGMEGNDELEKSLESYFEGRTKILLAKVEHAKRNYMGELDLYKEAAKFAPHDPYLSMALFDLGYLYYKRRDYRTASQIFEWAREANRELLEAHFYLAKSYEQQGLKDKAIEALKGLAQIRPDLAEKLISN